MGEMSWKLKQVNNPLINKHYICINPWKALTLSNKNFRNEKTRSKHHLRWHVIAMKLINLPLKLNSPYTNPWTANILTFNAQNSFATM